MAIERVPLSALQSAFIAMANEQYTLAIATATATRNARMKLLADECGVPDDTEVTIEPPIANGPAHLVFSIPDMPLTTLPEVPEELTRHG